MRTLLLAVSAIAANAAFNAAAPQSKTHWSKRVSVDIFAAGRLTERQIKYAKEDGFNSLAPIQLWSTAGTFGTYTLPSSTDAAALADSASFLRYTPADNDYLSVATFGAFATFLNTSTRPTLVYDDNAYKSVISILLYLYRAQTTDFVRSADDIYAVGKSIGFDYATDAYVNAAIARETGTTQRAVAAPSINLRNPNVLQFWWAKRVTDEFYDAGQFEAGHLPLIKTLFKAVINMRQTVTRSDTNAPTQESTNLLNVGGTPAVYNITLNSTGGTVYLPLRQTRAALTGTGGRVNAARPASWAAGFSGQELTTDNFEIFNPEEFGDREFGYNETIEAHAHHAAGVPYYAAPIGGVWGYTKDAYLHYRSIYSEAQSLGERPILVHCRTGYRTGFFSITHEAYSTGKSSAWAFDTAKSIGYYSFLTDVGLSATWNSLLNGTNPNPPGYGIPTNGASSVSVVAALLLAAVAAIYNVQQ